MKKGLYFIGGMSLGAVIIFLLLQYFDQNSMLRGVMTELNRQRESSLGDARMLPQDVFQNRGEMYD